MPLEVIMPALGMAQESGRIVAWHKQPGDAVARGDILFEVETDKATMEVEAQGDGYLTDVTASEGTDVPVGDVIAKISDTAETTASATDDDTAPEAAATAPGNDLPRGKEVIMPTLGMAQDTGLLVAWHKAPGDAVAADDVLFEVETDKSTAEVNAGADGYLAAVLAAEGDDVPVGRTIAVISAEAPENPVTRKAAPTPVPAKDKTAPAPDSAPRARKKAPAPAPKTAARPAQDDPILASPRARRLAREQGLDLSRLVRAGYQQPYHVRDLDTLRSLPDETVAGPGGSAAQASSRLTAEIPVEGFSAFAAWAGENARLTDSAALLAGFCAASLGSDTVVAVESFGRTTIFDASARLGATAPGEAEPQLHLRDLRFSAITSVQIGAADIPTLTLTAQGDGLAITLEFATGQLGATDAITLLSNFAGRMEQPLRHLL